MLKKSLLLLALSLSSAAWAGTAPAPLDPNTTIYDRLWQIPVLYSDKHNPWVEELRFTGRFHGDAYSADSDHGANTDWSIRRLRLGAKMKFLKDFSAGFEAEFATDGDEQTRITDAYLAWKPSKYFKLRLVKHAVRFTLDGSISSNELITLERNNLSNNFWFGNDRYLVGSTISGEARNWQWQAGFYSNSNDNQFSSLSEGSLSVLSLGYDFDHLFGVQKALLRADYVYNNEQLESSKDRAYRQVGSLSFQLRNCNWGLNTELAMGIGGGRQSDAWGFVVEPWYNLTAKIQLVARYTHLSSDDANGLKLNNHYEGTIVTEGRGDQYDEIYLGANYYIYGHRLKLQTGWQYAAMQDIQGGKGAYNGWTLSTGVRFSF